ncbi:MAG: NUDIX domain-containing protein [Bacteroidales bacterium]|nr:NUDIX domain-containing protein [Bacteroidales bacterium]
MHKIYFENRAVIICAPDDESLEDPNAVRFLLTSADAIHSFVEMFEASGELSRVFIPTDDIEATYRLFSGEFKEVSAGGGLVSNRRGDYLLINRNGLWDLPKGHQEPGEPIETTALREVQEETGIDKLQLRDLICITDHTYKRNGIWHLKHTWWYDMLYTDPTDLTPQREEDISKAAWVARSSLPPFLKNTFPSIAEVFREARV